MNGFKSRYLIDRVYRKFWTELNLFWCIRIYDIIWCLYYDHEIKKFVLTLSLDV